MDLSEITTQFIGNGSTTFGMMNRRDLAANSTLITNFINLAIMRIQRELRCPALEKWVTITIGGATATYGGYTYYVDSASYNATTGEVSLSLVVPSGQTLSLAGGNSVTVAGLTGTGSYADLNGSFTTDDDSAGITLTYSVSSGLTLTVVAYDPQVVIPNDYLELIGIYPQCDWVTRVRRDKLERATNYAQFQTDKPMIYARQGGVWVLGPAPAAGSTLLMGYYAELTPLVNPTDTNIISIVAWDLILYGALSEACRYYNDKRRGTTVGPGGKIIDGFEGKYNEILQNLQDMGAEDELDEGQMDLCHSFPDDDVDNYIIWVP